MRVSFSRNALVVFVAWGVIVSFCGALGGESGKPIQIRGSSVGRYLLPEVLKRFKGTTAQSVDFENTSNNLCSGMLAKHSVDVVLRTSDWNYTDKQQLAKAFPNPKHLPKRYELGRFVVYVIVNAKSPLKAIGQRKLGHIYRYRGRISNWSDVPGSGKKTQIRAFCAPRVTNEYYIFRIKGMDYHGCAKNVKVAPNTEAMIAGVARDADSIGYFLFDHRKKIDPRVRVLAIIPDMVREINRLPRTTPATATRPKFLPLDKLLPSSKPVRTLKPVAPSPRTIFERQYPLTDHLTLYVHPDAPALAHDVCKFIISEQNGALLRKHSLFPECDRLAYLAKKRLAEMKAGKGAAKAPKKPRKGTPKKKPERSKMATGASGAVQASHASHGRKPVVSSHGSDGREPVVSCAP